MKTVTWNFIIARATITQAVIDLTGPKTVRLEAVKWFTTRHCDNLCKVAQVAPDVLRQAVGLILKGTPAQALFITKKLKQQLMNSTGAIQLPT